MKPRRRQADGNRFRRRQLHTAGEAVFDSLRLDRLSFGSPTSYRWDLTGAIGDKTMKKEIEIGCLQTVTPWAFFAPIAHRMRHYT